MFVVVGETGAQCLLLVVRLAFLLLLVVVRLAYSVCCCR